MNVNVFETISMTVFTMYICQLMSVKIHANSRFIKQTQKTSRLSRSSHRESILCLLYSLSRSDRLNCKFQGLNPM